MDKKDYMAQIMDEWYSLMETNNVSVQPKASTLLGMVLSKYDIQKGQKRDIWAEYLTTTGGQFKSWYDSLTNDQQEEWHACAKQARVMHGKGLLKG